MKKQFQILAPIFITVVFISCSKETINKQQETAIEEISVKNSSAKPVDPLSINLEGWFAFNSSLKDKTGKLRDALSTNYTIFYVSDRKGKPKSAVNFDGTYGLRIFDVPQQTHTSLSLWLKPANADPSSTHIAEGLSWGPKVYEYNGNLAGGVTNGTGTLSSWMSGLSSSQWHHVVVTYDGNYLKVYLNKVLKVNAQFVGTIGSSLIDYLIAHDTYGGRWVGYLDDVRFYSRTLTATDVQNLFNQ